MKQIPLYKVFKSPLEKKFILESLNSGITGGDGPFTKKCTEYIQNKWKYKQVLLTTSCTHALEMAAILIDIKEGDEIIVPSYTFVSSVNAFILRGAKIVFADSNKANPNIQIEGLEKLITKKTKAIVIVHYAGIACEMEELTKICKKNSLYLIEDAAQALNGFYKGKALGSFGDLSAFSFHETKNISAGEGGMLVINNKKFYKRAEIVREKGTNRSAFFRGEINKYEWVDIGSSYLPSDLISAYLYAQLQVTDEIQKKRDALWAKYFEKLSCLTKYGIGIPEVPKHSKSNSHIFYLVCKNKDEREKLSLNLLKKGVKSSFHFSALHKSKYYLKDKRLKNLPNSERFEDCLLRLPLYHKLKNTEIEFICKSVLNFYKAL